MPSWISELPSSHAKETQLSFRPVWILVKISWGSWLFAIGSVLIKSHDSIQVSSHSCLRALLSQARLGHRLWADKTTFQVCDELWHMCACYVCPSHCHIPCPVPSKALIQQRGLPRPGHSTLLPRDVIMCVPSYHPFLTLLKTMFYQACFLSALSFVNCTHGCLCLGRYSSLPFLHCCASRCHVTCHYAAFSTLIPPSSVSFLVHCAEFLSFCPILHPGKQLHCHRGNNVCICWTWTDLILTR